MYWDYLRERENVEPIFSDNGFALVCIKDGYLYIRDIYVQPEFRKGGEGRALLAQAEALAASLNCEGILGSCSPAATNSTASMKAMLACGFELHKCEPDIIYLLKRVQKKDDSG
jgi:GNAT superfamily N-acetyltransferase